MSAETEINAPDTAIVQETPTTIKPNFKHEWFRLSKVRAGVLLIYLLLLAIGSGAALTILLIEEINPLKGLSTFSFSVVAASVTSLLGASIYYSRKLYKACINYDMLPAANAQDEVRQLGITCYYISRPLYAACLSLIVCIALRSGAEFISAGGALNEKYPYLVMIISFFVGYSSSDFIDELESKGKGIVGGIIKH